MQYFSEQFSDGGAAIYLGGDFCRSPCSESGRRAGQAFRSGGVAPQPQLEIKDGGSCEDKLR